MVEVVVVSGAVVDVVDVVGVVDGTVSTVVVVVSATDVLVVEVAAVPGRVEEVVDWLPPVGLVGPMTMGVDDPGLAFHPGGGFGCEGTGPAVGTTWAGAGATTDGG